MKKRDPIQITERPLFFWVLNRNRALQLLVVIAIIATLFFKVYPLEMQRRIINTAIRMGNEKLLFHYCGLYFGSVLIAALLKYFLNFIQRYIGQKAIMEIRRELYAHILTLPMQFFRANQPGTMINAMTAELNSVALFIGSALTTPLLNILTFFAFSGYMIYLNPKLGMISLTIYPVELIIIPMLQKKYNILNRKRVKITRGMSSTINEAVTGIHEVQGNAAYTIEQNKISAFILQIFQVMRPLFLYKFGIKFVNSMVQSVGPFILFLYGGYLAIHGHFTLGALVAFLSAYEKVYDPWKEMIEYYQEYQDAKIHYQQIMETFRLEPEYHMLPQNRYPYTLKGGIEVRNLDYNISGDVKLLNNVSFDIQPGHQVAIVGFSGSGKSTLALVLAQMYGYSGGSVRMDGHELSALTKADMSKNIGFVAQHPFIFTGTIRENMLYSCIALENIMRSDAFSQLSEKMKLETLHPGSNPPVHTLLDTSALSVHDDQELIHMIEATGFKEDIIRLGLNTVLDPEKWEKLLPSFIKIRHAIGASAKANLHNHVEHYEINTFMKHNTIYENLVFGEFNDENYSLKKIARNPLFIRFLKEEELYSPLLILGKSIAVETVNLLENFTEDDFFLQSSPIGRDQFKTYSDIVKRVAPPSDHISETDLAILLDLTLKYIPAFHHMVTLPDTLEKKIVQTRHQFMTRIGQADLNQCITLLEYMDNEEAGKILKENMNTPFRPYCPSQYQYTHSLLDNIIFGKVRYSSKGDIGTVIPLVIEFLIRENLFNDVMGIGLDFHVGSKGDRLSGGQKQKIALSRVLLKKSPVLILDEATASLDNSSQNKVQKLIRNGLKKGTTVLSVIHRLDMAKNYDHIIVLRAGQIVEQGSYSDLIDRKGVFHELAQL